MAISRVQATSVGQSGAASSLAKAFGAGNTNGNCLTVGPLIGSNSVSVTSVTDTAGNSNWTFYGSGNDSTLGASAEIWVCKNCKAGANTVTVQWAASTGFPGFVIAEYSGVDTSTATDCTTTSKGQTTNTTSYSANTVTTATNGAMVIAIAGFNAGGTTATGTGGTAIVDNDGTAKEFFASELLASTAGANNTTATLSPADQFLVVQGALKPAAGGGGSPVRSPYYEYYYRTLVQEVV